jgi:hypothetical protein
MEYNLKGIPLGRQGRRGDWAEVGVLKLAQVANQEINSLILLRRGVNFPFAELNRIPES